MCDTRFLTSKRCTHVKSDVNGKKCVSSFLKGTRFYVIGACNRLIQHLPLEKRVSVQKFFRKSVCLSFNKYRFYKVSELR